jgi:AcrR family transcriptional regulator
VIVSCFERTFDLMRRFQHAAVAQSPNQWEALSAVAATLVDFQMSSDGPLLRFSALSALPETIREKMVDESNRVSLRFAAMIADGVAEGSLRPVDPAIAAQMINAGLNASAELVAWMADLDRARAARLFARPMLMGLFTKP